MLVKILTLICEGAVACFIPLIVCVVGIANGPEGLVCLYEKEVQKRAVEKGLITEAKIKRNNLISSLCLMIPLIAFVLAAVYVINGARGFWDGFWQITVIVMIEGLFDRLFIDLYWVGKTKAWNIPETDDLRPYIYGKTLVTKWVMTLVGYPVLAAAVAALMSLIIK